MSKRTTKKKFPSFLLSQCPKHILNDKEHVIEAVSQCGSELKYAPKHLQNDKQVVLAAISDDPESYRYATEETRNIPSIAMEALLRTNHQDQVDIIIQSLPNKLKEEESFIKWILSFKKSTIPLIHFPKFTNDKKICLLACKKSPSNINGLSDELRNDKEFMMSILRHNMECFPYFGEDVRGNREIAIPIVESNYLFWEFLDFNLKREKDFFLACVRKCGCSSAERFISQYFNEFPEMLHDFEIVKELLDMNAKYYFFLPNDLQTNKLVVIETVKKNPELLSKISEDFKMDVDVVIAAAKIDIKSLHHVPKECRKNHEFTREIIFALDTKELPGFRADVIKNATKTCTVKSARK